MALKEGAWKGAAGEQVEQKQDMHGGCSSHRHHCLPHAPAGEGLGRGNAKMHAHAHAQTAV